ncbi:MAG: GNAT family N-acetyltransferase [Candidatus Altiarchaeota archaeon]
MVRVSYTVRKKKQTEVIRRLRHKDIPEIKSMMKEGNVFTDTDVKGISDMIRNYFLDPEGEEMRTYVYKVDDAVAGFVTFGVDNGVDAYEIYALSVHPDYQGRGIGSRLIKFAEARIREKRSRLICISTSSAQEYSPARRLYRRTGYNRVAMVKDFFSEGENKIIYCKRLRKKKG